MKRSRKIEERSRKTEEYRGKQKKIEENRGNQKRSRKIEEFDVRKVWVLFGNIRVFRFFGGVHVLEMFGFDEWVSRATLSMFRFMPTLGCAPLAEGPTEQTGC